MAISYSYTKDANQSTLIKEIQDSSIVAILGGISARDGNNIDILFNDTLSAGDITTLDGIVSAHTYTSGEETIEGLPMVSLSFGNSTGTPLQGETTKNKRLQSFVFQGTDFWGKSPVAVKISCYMQAGGETGTIRLYDITNDVELGLLTVTNTTEAALEVTCSGWSNGEAIIELQAKTTHKKVPVNITAISILG